MDTLSKNYLANSLQAAEEMHGQKQHISGQKEKETYFQHYKKKRRPSSRRPFILFIYIYLFVYLTGRGHNYLALPELS